ncbi:MAG: MFS transporter [Planctomycetes bacterium]|nr:MFS transporter [Planctomycetota bacterium]
MSEATQPDGAATTQKPTRIRYFIVAAAAIMSFLLYLDRFCVSFAIDYMRQDLDLTQAQAARFLGLFFWSYALAQVPAGWLSDRYGARIMLVIYILTWSAFTGVIGAAPSFFILMVGRLFCGLGQAGAYPTAASIVGRWMPTGARGSASAVVAMGGRIGGAAAFVMTSHLIVMLVPLGTPVEITPKDVLVGAEMIERLQADTADDFSEVARAKLLREHLTSEQLGQLDAATFVLDGEGDDAKRVYSGVSNETLAAIANSLIDQARIYDESLMGNLKLPNEALAMLKRVNAKEELTDAERARFHRFLLEGVFPNAIAKLYGKGWRPILYIYAAAGLFVAGLFWLVFYNRPEVHPWSNSAEHALILKGREEVAQNEQKKLEAAPVWPLAKSMNMWFNCISQWGTNVGWLFLVTWLPRYLMEVHNVPIIQRGYMTMTPVLIGMIGMLSGGRATDFVAAKLGVKWGRRLPIGVSRAVAVVAYLCCIGITTALPEDSTLNTPWVFVGLLSVVAFSTDFGTPSSWAFAQDIGGRQVGSVLGWGNMWGNLGAALSPEIYNFFLGETPTLKEWNTMFAVCAAGYLLSGICGMMMDASKPIEGVE